ncbi:hypothetical protein [Tropicibacter naphthalenivorans]|uniref:Uncharacterized protein n=1 Tax=Tropicibacter naphthalenivorans TaxID=441103 RepID=A0A0P1GXT4_9RHOB|nr:hypothetical protein [Tropicibacter naphthalenivorans]CUH80715.1 hypothetical protein TRN7648_03108 [Tropicibacter naphthalenivorans]SMC89482.1 hypothetical protein SAMN04488093_10678 [Tropicibacter naphthalenivorans]
MTDFLSRADKIRQDIQDARELARAGLDRLGLAYAELEDLVQDTLKAPPSEALRCDVPVTDHRRAHRSGRPAKLDSDPELRAFVLARIDRLTFPQIEADIAEAFPEDRRVRKSAIHAWWTRRKSL